MSRKWITKTHFGDEMGLSEPIYFQDERYKCQFDSNTGDWWVQVGPDPAIKIDIKLGDT